MKHDTLILVRVGRVENLVNCLFLNSADCGDFLYHKMALVIFLQWFLLITQCSFKMTMTLKVAHDENRTIECTVLLQKGAPHLHLMAILCLKF